MNVFVTKTIRLVCIYFIVLVLFVYVYLNVEVQDSIGHFYYIKTKLFLRISDPRLATPQKFEQLFSKAKRKWETDPKLIEVQNKVRRIDQSELTKEEKLFEISKVIQKQLEEHLDNSEKDCSNIITLKCTLYDPNCGLGCHIHHKIKCLIFSYVLQIPWIHDEKFSWTFSDSWSTYFKPVGSKCEVNNLTIFLELALETELKIDLLKSGLPIHRTVFNVITKNSDSSFAWMVGQFAQFIFKINSETLKKIEDYKKFLGIHQNKPLIGMHVRRTDKLIREANFTPNAEFMLTAEYYKRNQRLQGNVTVFIASETNEVLPEFGKKFTSSPSDSWIFLGSESQRGFSVKDRRSQLFEIIRDIKILLDCDFVICTFSSNVCRLLLELKVGLGRHPSEIQSLDSFYRFVASNNGIKPELISM